MFAHLGSTVLETDDSDNRHATQIHFAFGARRGGTALTPATENQYTGQKLDGTGLYYYNARYYDPAIGQFVSPDTIVPDASRVMDYNRYMYGYGNPIRNADPSGHTPWDVIDVGFWVWSAKDFAQNPSWGNAGWLAADTVSLLPIIPSSGYATRGARMLRRGDQAADTARRTANVAQGADEIAGAGIGRWTRHNEVVDQSVIQQVEGNWCVLACAEMLTNGGATQRQLSGLVDIVSAGTDPEAVAAVLNRLDPNAVKTWTAGNVLHLPDPFGAVSSTGSWGAMMKIDGGHHMIIVDGIDEAGMVMVRDPYAASRYNTTLDEFHAFWTENVLFSQ